jgi:hypothetical protein
VSDVPKLTELAQGGRLEPHPVSGEVEVDWDYDLDIKYRRLDSETLQALVVIREFDLFFRLVFCTGDKEGGGDGWRVGEVGVASSPSVVPSFGGQESISEAERQFEKAEPSGRATNNRLYDAGANEEEDDDDDDDDDYWARYDGTPARSPAVKRSPAPRSMQPSAQAQGADISSYRSQSAEDAYFAQYDSVQPAMDNHDPDEVVEPAHVAPPLGLARPVTSNDSSEHSEINETSGVWTLADAIQRSPSGRADDEERAAALVHPRPASSASSSGSLSVAKLEEAAEKRDQSEFGVKQHVSRSIRSLFMLSRASGIDREEFERMVRTELDVLGMVEENI